MTMEREEFSPEESLQIIRKMIDQTRDDFGNRSTPFLVWGWLVFSICFLQFILLYFFNNPRSYEAWWLIWVGILYTVIRSLQAKRTERVRTLAGETMSTLWMTLFISFIVLGFICALQGWNAAFPLYILLYGIGTVLSGRILRFPPLTYGGIACWPMALLAAAIPYEWQILVSAAAILISYIIPGHLLLIDHKRKTASLPHDK